MKFNSAIFDQFPVIESRRLKLRSIQLSDAEDILEIRSSELVNRFIAREPMENIGDAMKLVERTLDAYKNGLAIGWAGIHRESGDMIGTCGFNKIEPENLWAEIGGELSTRYWGKSIANEAVTEIVRFGLNVMNLHTIEAKVSPANRSAIFLLEKLGFMKEAHFHDRIYFNGKFEDMAVYTLIKGRETI